MPPLSCITLYKDTVALRDQTDYNLNRGKVAKREEDQIMCVLIT